MRRSAGIRRIKFPLFLSPVNAILEGPMLLPPGRSHGIGHLLDASLIVAQQTPLRHSYRGVRAWAFVAHAAQQTRCEGPLFLLFCVAMGSPLRPFVPHI
jgi:hypothetical protein